MTDHQPISEAPAHELEIVPEDVTHHLDVDDVDGTPSAAEMGIELPDDPAAAHGLLLRELAEARAEASEYLESLQRVAAEFDNYRKRIERDQAENVMRASQRLVETLLPTLDAFDAALALEAQTPAEEKILDGMRGTHTQLMDSLAREGVAPIAAEGRPFDPAVHEAVAGGGDGELIVGAELRRGYTLRDRVLRPSLVMVMPSPAGDEAEEPEEAS
jgi:molecular chaperone GrpE